MLWLETNFPYTLILDNSMELSKERFAGLSDVKYSPSAEWGKERGVKTQNFQMG